MQARAVAIAAVAVTAGCGKSSGKPVETGRLCFAANPPEVFVWQEQPVGAAAEGPKVDYLADKPTAIRFRKELISQPSQEVAIPDARAGELVELVREGKVTDSFRVSFKRLGKDLCYYFRPYRDRSRTAGWILDTDREKDRCNCFPPAAPPAAPAPGSGSEQGR